MRLSRGVALLLASSLPGAGCGGLTTNTELTAGVYDLVSVNNSDAYNAACLAGLGIAQSPRWGLAPQIGTGALVEVLPEHTCAPMPIAILHAYDKNVPRRVRYPVSTSAPCAARSSQRSSPRSPEAPTTRTTGRDSVTAAMS